MKHTPGLVLASSLGLSNITALLLQQGVRIEEEDSRSVRALHQAIWKQHHPIVQLLLDKGADCSAEINSPEAPLHSATVMQGAPLHLAAIKGNISFAEKLIEKGVEVNIRLSNGWTPLHMAAANGHTRCRAFDKLRG